MKSEKWSFKNYNAFQFFLLFFLGISSLLETLRMLSLIFGHLCESSRIQVNDLFSRVAFPGERVHEGERGGGKSTGRGARGIHGEEMPREGVRGFDEIT